MSKYDYVIVGAGLFGSVFANLATAAGKSCIILDRRNHVAGNCYTETKDQINVHTYGAHIFHTSNKDVWNYVNKYATFNHYKHSLKVVNNDNLYSFPINLFTLYQLWGCRTPREAQAKLDSVKISIESPTNLEEWILSQVGEEIYHTFICGYTKKQWGTDPKNLPSEIIKRLPIRLDFNDNYFFDTYQGIPIGGYTKMFENMTRGIPIELGVDFLKHRAYWQSRGKQIVYTGALDELFDNCFGKLGYRSLRFEHEHLPISDYQGTSVVNYTNENVPYTRIIEHKHFEFGKTDTTIITKEYPLTPNQSGDEKYYPINDSVNTDLYQKYKTLCSTEFPTMILGGRLASYRYYDMHQVIAQAFHAYQSLRH